jgi:putative FmdB family regulatory protein
MPPIAMSKESHEMPEYDYRCAECDNRFVITRPMSSKENPCCPECGSAAKRVFTPVGVAFKGSGFHNTDYKNRPEPKETPCATPGAAAP